ncbi:hypothetical protein V2J09_002247 [Rumex salicifolius]
MADSETVVPHSSTGVDYASESYPSSNHVDADTNAAASLDGFTDSASHVKPSSEIPFVQEAIITGSDERKVSDGEEYSKHMHEGVEKSPLELNQASFYGENTNGDMTNGVNGTAPNGAQGMVVEEPLSVLSAEEERLWSIVRTNSVDFNAWTSLIEETERTAESNIQSIRKVYDAFLAEFPLCYGYWKKYADHEARVGAIDKVVEVYERACQGVTYSVDMWLHYCSFAIGTYGDPDTVRRLFERGLAYVGTDYLSSPLWDKYIEYEYTQQEWARLAMIYTRILENPIQNLDRYLNSFKELAGSRPLAELRNTEEAAAANPHPASDGERLEEARPEGTEESTPDSSGSLSDAEELEKYIAIREEMYKKAKEFDSKIIGFETAIRRPYFHVRCLNDPELENWHNYLDFIEREGDMNKNYFTNVENAVLNQIVKLYERCLIACANYPEFWIRYILCMEASGRMDLADNALARATQVFVKRLPEIHIFAARFKEQQADVSGARAAYQLVHSEIAPGLLEAIIDHGNMERRLGNMDAAFSIYEQAIAIEKGKEQSQALPMLFAQYARFMFLVNGNAEKAREILDEALEKVQLSKPLLEALIHLESIMTLPKRIDYLDSLVEKFLMPDPNNSHIVSIVEREELSKIYLEFLGLFGDTSSIRKAKDRHARLFLRRRSSSESRKRDAEDYLASDKAKLAKSYSGTASTTTSVMSAQWPTGYAAPTQAWPQVAQAQAQPWNPSYPQQAAYPGYYGTTYTQPQVPAASVPQVAAYGAYPAATYPTQAYPQPQTYAAPGPAVAVAPAQQPAAAPQAYYGAY